MLWFFMKTKTLVRILFTQNKCKTCDDALWKRVNGSEAMAHISNILNEEHKYYECVGCNLIGFKIKVYEIF